MSEKKERGDIHITNNYYAPIGQHIDHVDTIHFSMDGNGTFHFGHVEQMEVTEKPRPTKAEDRKEPSPLMTDGARKYWQRLQQAHFVDADCRLLPDTTRKQAMYIADLFADKLRLTSKWKPFQDLWGINNLAQEKWEVQQTGTLPSRYYEIDKIFED